MSKTCFEFLCHLVGKGFCEINRAGGLLSEDEGDGDRVAAVGMSYEDRKAIQRAKGRLDKVVKLVESKEVQSFLWLNALAMLDVIDSLCEPYYVEPV